MLPRPEQLLLKFISTDRLNGFKCKWIDLTRSILTCIVIIYYRLNLPEQKTKSRLFSYITKYINILMVATLTQLQVSNSFLYRGILTSWPSKKYSKAEKLFIKLNPQKIYYSLWGGDANCFYAFILPNEILTKKVDACLARAAVWEWQPFDGNRGFTQRIHKVFLYLLHNSSSTHLHLNERLVISNLVKNSLNTYIHF